MNCVYALCVDMYVVYAYSSEHDADHPNFFWAYRCF